MFRKIRHSRNDAIASLKFVLLILLVILTPIALFLTAFSWYVSFEVWKTNNIGLTKLALFWKNALIFGIIGLISFLFYFFLFLVINFFLKRVVYKWKKIILIIVIISVTIVFLLFEIFSAIFISYFYTWQLSLVLTFWPLIYVLLSVLSLINYFEFYNAHKNLNNKDSHEKYSDLFASSMNDTIY